jgi:RNA polymerase sigma factor (sigma-70 family)
MSDATTLTVEELMTHAGWLRRMAAGLLGSADGAEDALQETFITALRRPPRPGGSLRAWFATVATNHIRLEARTQRRRLSKAERAAAEPEEGVRTPEQIVAGIELQRWIATLLLELDGRFREVIYLRYFDDLDSPAIAQRLGISAGTVRWRLKMGLDELRVRLDARDGEGGARWRRALAPLSLPLAGLRAGGWAAAIRAPLLLAGGATLTLAVVTVAGLGGWWGQPDRRIESPTSGATQASSAAGPSRAERLPPPAFVVAEPGGPSSGPDQNELALAAVVAEPGTDMADPPRARLAPFTGVRWRGEIPEVEVGGAWWELLSIDGVPAARIVAFCKERYGRPADLLWRKRFSEDLVEVLAGMGKPPAAQVSLGLRSLTDGRQSLVQSPMNSENRQRVWLKNQQSHAPAADRPSSATDTPSSAATASKPSSGTADKPTSGTADKPSAGADKPTSGTAGKPSGGADKTPDPTSKPPAASDFQRVSPFTNLRFEADGIRVELEGAWYQLLRFQDIPTDRLISFAKERYGARWNKRIAEDPAELLVDIGARPGPTVDLQLEDLATGRTAERRAVPMTRENRRRLKDAWGPR